MCFCSLFQNGFIYILYDSIRCHSDFHSHSVSSILVQDFFSQPILSLYLSHAVCLKRWRCLPLFFFSLERAMRNNNVLMMLAHFQRYMEEIGWNGMHIANDCKWKFQYKHKAFWSECCGQKKIEWNSTCTSSSRERIAKNNSKLKILKFYGVFVALSHTHTHT